MNKKNIFKILIIVIGIIFFIMGCFSIYKFIIINKIFNKMEEYVAIENYYMKIINPEDSSGAMEIYYKDGIGKLVMSDGSYTWTNGTEAYLVDVENKKIQTIDINNPSSLLISNEFLASIVPGYSRGLIQKFFLVGDIKTSIKTKKYDGIKYYMITTNEKEKKSVWIHYDNLLPSQASVEIGELKKSYNYDIEFNKVKIEDVTKPNLEEYTFAQ